MRGVAETEEEGRLKQDNARSSREATVVLQLVVQVHAGNKLVKVLPP
jgi:hypothetical protein